MLATAVACADRPVKATATSHEVAIQHRPDRRGTRGTAAPPSPAATMTGMPACAIATTSVRPSSSSASTTAYRAKRLKNRDFSARLILAILAKGVGFRVDSSLSLGPFGHCLRELRSPQRHAWAARTCWWHAHGLMTSISGESRISCE